MAFAVIQTGGKQYRVSVGNKLKVEKLMGENDLPAQVGAVISFDKVLLVVDGDTMKLGSPYVAGAKVEGKVLKQGRNKKVIVFKYKSKTRQRKKKGHRQTFTEMEITKI